MLWYLYCDETLKLGIRATKRWYLDQEIARLWDSTMSSVKLFQIADLACLLIVGLVNALLGLVIPPYRRGFFCNDDSIKYPYTSEESLPTWAVIVVSVVVPVIVVSIYVLSVWKIASFKQMFLNVAQHFPRRDDQFVQEFVAWVIQTRKVTACFLLEAFQRSRRFCHILTTTKNILS